MDSDRPVARVVAHAVVDLHGPLWYDGGRSFGVVLSAGEMLGVGECMDGEKIQHTKEHKDARKLEHQPV